RRSGRPERHRRGRNFRGSQPPSGGVVLDCRGQFTAHRRERSRRRGTSFCQGGSVKSRALLLSALLLTACGYHVGGKADLLPKTIHTIAVPAFANTTPRYRLTDRIPAAITREFISRTRYQVIPNVNEADAVLTGVVTNFFSFPTTFDSKTGR